jgi:hypothetical protein
VDDLLLSEDELSLVLWAFSGIQVTACTPDYFRGFLEARLRGRSPALADRVASATAAQIEWLCRRVREEQGGSG